MKRIIFIALILLGIIAPTTYAQISKKKVAVYMTGEIEQSYKKVIGAKLVSAITATDEYAAVERTADFLAALASEQDYQTSGAVKDSQIARIGQQFGVRYVVVADVNELFDEIFIAARLINVETGLVEKAADASAAAESMTQLLELSTQISNKLLLGSAVAVSTTPIHHSLCASKDGKIFYITQEKWNKMDDTTRSLYRKLGFCIIKDKETKIYVGYSWVKNQEQLDMLPHAADYEWSLLLNSNASYYDSLAHKFEYGDLWKGPNGSNMGFLYKGSQRFKKYNNNTLWAKSLGGSDEPVRGYQGTDPSCGYLYYIVMDLDNIPL